MMRSLTCRLACAALLLSAAHVSAQAPATEAAPGAGSVWKLVIQSGVKYAPDPATPPTEKPMTVYVAVAGDAVRYAVATALTFNKMLYDVDVSEMRMVNEKTMRGGLKVTIQPDNWVPADKKPILCDYAIDVTADGRRLAGVVAGKCGDRPVAGAISGEVSANGGKLVSGALNLTLNDALCGGQPHLRDATVTLNYGDGGRTSNMKVAWLRKDAFHWKGTMEEAKVTHSGESFTGVLRARIAPSSAGLEGGVYTWTVDGKCFGDFIAGRFRVELEGKERKESFFWAEAKDAKWAAAG